MSTNSGIPDFRGPNGIYTRANIQNPESIFDIDYFYEDPSLFYKFHKTFLEMIQQAEPTFTHKFLVQIEEENKLSGIITQNIDSLHQKAGSKKSIRNTRRMLGQLLFKMWKTLHTGRLKQKKCSKKAYQNVINVEEL